MALPEESYKGCLQDRGALKESLREENISHHVNFLTCVQTEWQFGVEVGRVSHQHMRQPSR